MKDAPWRDLEQRPAAAHPKASSPASISHTPPPWRSRGQRPAATQSKASSPASSSRTPPPWKNEEQCLAAAQGAPPRQEARGGAARSKARPQEPKREDRDLPGPAADGSRQKRKAAETTEEKVAIQKVMIIDTKTTPEDSTIPDNTGRGDDAPAEECDDGFPDWGGR
jgi:hypothetical protein